jgi:hypothetical protein
VIPPQDRPPVDRLALALGVLFVLVWVVVVVLAGSGEAPADELPGAAYVVDTPTAQAERVP